MNPENDDKISTDQVKIMSYEIGELLVKLKKDSVFDFEENIPIVLLDRRSSLINFRRTEVLEVKRFTSLVHRHLPILSYLVRNPSFENNTEPVDRNDRIMGAIDYGRTVAYREKYPTANTAVCLEIHRNYIVPENLLLAITLFAILTYCDTCIKLQGLIESNQINPTIKELQSIRSYVTILLSMKFIRQILPNALESRNKVHHLLYAVLERVRQNKAPKYFAKIVDLFYKWRYYISVSLNENEIAEHFLQYHFMNLADTNDLYECWVFSKILYALAQKYNLKLKEVRSRKGIVTFKNTDNSFTLIYQANYPSDWMDEGKPIPDIPDLALEFRNGRNMIIDAKNMLYSPHSNIHQMRSYMTTLVAKYGIFVHSASQIPNLWKVIPDKSNNEIIWTSLIPGHEGKANKENLEKILELISEIS